MPTTPNSNPQRSRSTDLLDMLVGFQQQGQPAAPNTSPYYIGTPEGVSMTDTGGMVNEGPGAGYLCHASATGPNPNEIWCGFWSCS